MIWGIIVAIVIGISAQQWQALPASICYYRADWIYQTNMADLESILHMDEGLKDLERESLEQIYQQDLEYCDSRGGL